MFETLLPAIGASLQRQGLPYMIIGGQAVLLYGEPRLTRDIDVTLGVTIDRIQDLLASVEELALTALPEDIEAFVRQTMVLPTLEPSTGIRVDFIFSFTPYEPEAITRTTKRVLMGQEVCFASPEDLIIHKIFAGRPRDLEDVRLVLLRQANIETVYIKKWLREFDAPRGGGHFLETFEERLREF